MQNFVIRVHIYISQIFMLMYILSECQSRYVSSAYDPFVLSTYVPSNNILPIKT
jgi:hypothetical protein